MVNYPEWMAFEGRQLYDKHINDPKSTTPRPYRPYYVNMPSIYKRTDYIELQGFGLLSLLPISRYYTGLVNKIIQACFRVFLCSYFTLLCHHFRTMFIGDQSLIRCKGMIAIKFRYLKWNHIFLCIVMVCCFCTARLPAMYPCFLREIMDSTDTCLEK